MVLKKFPVVPITFKTVLKLYTILSKGFKVVANFEKTVKKIQISEQRIRYRTIKIQSKY